MTKRTGGPRPPVRRRLLRAAGAPAHRAFGMPSSYRTTGRTILDR